MSHESLFAFALQEKFPEIYTRTSNQTEGNTPGRRLPLTAYPGNYSGNFFLWIMLKIVKIDSKNYNSINSYITTENNNNNDQDLQIAEKNMTQYAETKNQQASNQNPIQIQPKDITNSSFAFQLTSSAFENSSVFPTQTQ